MKLLPKGILIGIGALALTTLSIKAFDYASLPQSASIGSAGITQNTCPVGMSLLTLGERALCVDSYEASAGSDCPYESPETGRATEENIAQGSCSPTSEKERTPWAYVSLTQAQQLCARASKRVPSISEWYAYSLGVTNEASCIFDSAEAKLTGTSECVNPLGVYDPIGNVWEWVAAEVRDGQLDGKKLPASGYVNEVDLVGLPLVTSESSSDAFGNDYATFNAQGTFGMVRGGFYGSGTDGGLFALNAAVPHSIATPGIGFRCVQDVHQ